LGVFDNLYSWKFVAGRRNRLWCINCIDEEGRRRTMRSTVNLGDALGMAALLLSCVLVNKLPSTRMV